MAYAASTDNQTAAVPPASVLRSLFDYLLVNACLSFSADGFLWSPIRSALRCGAIGERTIDHPASPAMVRGVGNEMGLVHVYIQHYVPSIGLDRMTPWTLVSTRAPIRSSYLPGLDVTLCVLPSFAVQEKDTSRTSFECCKVYIGVMQPHQSHQARSGQHARPQ